MEREVFEQDDVAECLNAHFISIKVDREERPDLDAAYMAAVQAMTGSGGWPMSVLLTPSLRPFFGGTYFPHEQFLKLVEAGAEQFATARNAVENQSAKVHAALAARDPSPPAGALTGGELRAIAGSSLSELDPEWGGFRGRTKFPTPVKWQFLLHAYRKWGDPELARALHKTLDAMASGGLRDQIAGGFFRYSTEPSWTVPHFEKMLYDNAQLASLYLEAAVALAEPRYRTIALDTLDFVLREFLTPQAAFGASFDADADGKEGATYLWRPEQLRAVLGASDAASVASLLGVTESGNFEGATIPTLRAVAAADSATWQRARPLLLEARRRRVQPRFDPKLVTAWNGLALTALAAGYRASGERRLREAAENAAKALWSLNRDASGELLRASDQGHPGSPAVLDDYACLSNGLVELFEATGDALYLEQATSLATSALTRFAKPGGGWFLTSGATQEPLGRRVETYDGVEPSGNASLLLALEKLAALTGRTDFSAAAEQARQRYAGDMRSGRLDMAGWLDSALLADGPYYELVIAGPDGGLSDVWRDLSPAWLVGVRLGAEGPTPAQERAMPTSSNKRARAGLALGYVCVHGACDAPTSDPARLRLAVLNGWTR
jgi:uncharacterized protein YyaL (SSP411 family)